MNEPLFLSDSNTRIPGRIRYKLSEELYIPEKMIPWINCSVQAKSKSFDNLYAIGIEEYPHWIDYYRIYGDDVLLWQGNLNGSPATLIPGDNLGELKDAYIIDPDLIETFPIIQFPATGNEWRAKYPTIIQGGSFKPKWSFDGETINCIIEHISDEEKQLIASGQKDEYRKVSLSFLLPGPNYSSGDTNPPHGDPVFPYPPGYPPSPLYNTVTLTKNIPEPEALTNVTGINNSYCEYSIIKIGDNKYKIFANGEIFYYSKDLEWTNSYQTIQGTWTAEKFEYRYTTGNLWGWTRGWLYKISSVSASGSITKRSGYLSEDGNIDLKLKIFVQNPGGFI